MHIGWQKWKATRKGDCLESCKHTIVEWVSDRVAKWGWNETNKLFSCR